MVNEGTTETTNGRRRLNQENRPGTTRVNILSFGQLFSISCGSRPPEVGPYGGETGMVGGGEG